jgi:3-(3-hydroxy-phenyl)propionate hydroxylase
MQTYSFPRYEFVPPPELNGEAASRRRVAIVGAGPVGLAAAIDLAGRGIECVVLDDDNTVSHGSRAICWAKRALEVLDRLGVARRMVEKGVTWQSGKVHFGDRAIYRFDLADDGRQRFPAFINLQQYYTEEYLVDRATAMAGIELRWSSKVVDIEATDDGATLRVETPEGGYDLAADWVIAADGARSQVRRMMGLDFVGRVFEDRFLIADVVMRADFPKERWFWFDPPFNPDQSALLHMQADNVWRIDLQLGWEADPEEERKPEKVVPRIERMLGPDAAFDLEWTSVYTFQCQRLEKFRHGRVLFAGDAAHQVSPFGARGANSGLQDIDNLAWKLALVLNRQAPEALLDSYDSERVQAADENILNSTRATDFISPKSAASRAFRDGTLDLAIDWPFARDLVNSGRLSRPATHADSPLNGPAIDAVVRPGAPCPDAAIHWAVPGGDPQDGWLLEHLGGGFAVLCFGAEVAVSSGLDQLADDTIPIALLSVGEAPGGPGTSVVDADGQLARLFAGGAPGSTFLFRPDQHLCASWNEANVVAVRAARDHACGLRRD